jgi:hypothetical protein
VSKGFLVVQRTTADILKSYHPGYQGVYRTPPWSQKDYEGGFRDPYVFGNYANEAGIIPTLSAARDVLDRFSERYPPNNLEIIYVAERHHRSKPDVPKSLGRHFLGFDVAGPSSPFWSIVVDSPPPSDKRFRNALGRLNEFGLFNTSQEASKYLKDYRTHDLPDSNLPLTVWKVYRIDNGQPPSSQSCR